MIDIGFIGLGTMGRPMAAICRPPAIAVPARRRAGRAGADRGGGVACKSGKEVGAGG